MRAIKFQNLIDDVQSNACFHWSPITMNWMWYHMWHFSRKRWVKNVWYHGNILCVRSEEAVVNTVVSTVELIFLYTTVYCFKRHLYFYLRSISYILLYVKFCSCNASYIYILSWYMIVIHNCKYLIKQSLFNFKVTNINIFNNRITAKINK